MIPASIIIKNNKLPDSPGVYFYYDVMDKLLYIGKATSLKARVGSYFNKAHEARIEDLVRNIVRIEYIETPSVIEALVLEANQIKLHQPPYNVMQRDDKSFLYLCITNEEWPKPVLQRGFDLERMGIEPFSKTLMAIAKKKFLAVYGPYISGKSLRIALDLIRKTIPWSTCSVGQKKPCFDAQIGKCPGVCCGAITKVKYRKVISELMLFFSGKKEQLLRKLTKEMLQAASIKNFEEAAILRNRVFALEHIHDVSLITRSDEEEIKKSWKTVRTVRPYINIDGRLEAYDVAHISGTATVASMVVFVNGKPAKELYRKFRIKTVEGVNDVASMEEVLRRRLVRAKMTPQTWGLPELMIIDGGEGQIARVQSVLDEFGVKTPIVGIAKGFARKQDRMVYDVSNKELQRIVLTFKDKLAEVRDEAHRFAGVYHRILRSRNSFGRLASKRNP